MDRASRQVGGMAVLLAVVGAGALWWQLKPSVRREATAEVAVVRGPGATAPHVERVVTAPAPNPATMVAADPVVAARRDTKVLKTIVAKPMGDMGVLDGAMATQERDAATANPTEQAMRNALMNVPALTGGAEPPRVLCVRTTCEVTGRAAAGRPVAEVERALRDPTMLHSMVAHGYMPGPATVAAGADGTVGYVLYLNNEM